jgi:glucokinase
MTGWRLVSDAGGTNVRFARAAANAEIAGTKSYPVSHFPSFLTALQFYLEETGGHEGCEGVAVGAAGAVVSGTVTLTNVAWKISQSEISGELKVPCALINDVQAVAFSIPTLAQQALALLGNHAPDLANAQRLLVANIGTGFGAATLIRAGAGWVSCPSEAGHMSISFKSDGGEQYEGRLRSVEHILSGRGICNLHSALSQLPCEYDPGSLISQASTDLLCRQTLRVFTEIAGEVLGNLTLAVAAWDGVYLCGTVARSFARSADLSLLRKSFNDKGPMTEKMKQIPIALITREDAALAGLAALPLNPAS